MHVKGVPAFANQQSTVIAWVFARRTGSVELDSTYTADIILWHIPSPGGYGVPFFDGDFHGLMCSLTQGRTEICMGSKAFGGRVLAIC